LLLSDGRTDPRLIAINQWADTQVAAEIEEIDAAVLPGDLPLDAYLARIRCMAKALFAVALWLCTSLSVLAATPQKSPRHGAS